MRFNLTVVLVLSAAIVVGCTFADNATDAPGTAAGSVTLLAPADFQSSITDGGVFVVNVHVPYEGEIKGTDAFIPFDEIQEHAAELPGDKAAPLYIYCRSGRMSAEATADLQRLGYSNIIDLDGGMQAWEEAGLPLVQGSTLASPRLSVGGTDRSHQALPIEPREDA